MAASVVFCPAARGRAPSGLNRAGLAGMGRGVGVVV